MIKEFFKNILKELYGDEINRVTHDFVKEQFEETLDRQISDALLPVMKQISDLNKEIESKVTDIRKIVNDDIKVAKNVISKSLAVWVCVFPGFSALYPISLLILAGISKYLVILAFMESSRLRYILSISNKLFCRVCFAFSVLSIEEELDVLILGSYL